MLRFLFVKFYKVSRGRKKNKQKQLNKISIKNKIENKNFNNLIKIMTLGN